MSDTVVAPDISRWDKSFFGHPRGLSTLFFTEMWERFSYYGMRALLILFMTAATTKGGLGFPTAKAGAVYGMYTALVYLCGLPGGWIADRIIGPRRAVLFGGIVIALGEFSLAIRDVRSFYIGLGFIIVGTGLLKPNVSTMVGELYPPHDARRDAGFSIFYMGINLGALVSPLVCGYLGENIDWHYGFLAAGVGMVLGLAQYLWGARFLGSAGVSASGTESDRRIFRYGLAAAAAIALSLLVIAPDAQLLSDVFAVLLVIVVALVFGYLLTSKAYSHEERGRFAVILVLFLGSVGFWAASEQAGSTLNLFAERNTNLHVWDSSLWGLFRASYMQSFNSVFIVLLAPIVGWIWVRLGRHNPSSTAKFSIGLLFNCVGFAILIPISRSANVSPWWLTISYFTQTIGELCLSPVGLSAMTKLAPRRAVGMIMGVWFLSVSAGNFVAGRLASFYETMSLPTLFGSVTALTLVLGLVLAALIRPMRRLTGAAE
jgi:POT family proton-dependent oligopeptide transporter